MQYRVCHGIRKVLCEEGDDLPRPETALLVTHTLDAITKVILLLFQMAMLEASTGAWLKKDVPVSKV
jgi:hypothetical protein